MNQDELIEKCRLADGINLQPNLCEACSYEAMRRRGRDEVLKAGFRRVEL